VSAKDTPEKCQWSKLSARLQRKGYWDRLSIQNRATGIERKGGHTAVKEPKTCYVQLDLKDQLKNPICQVGLEV
jgi:hypothetical protein